MGFRSVLALFVWMLAVSGAAVAGPSTDSDAFSRCEALLLQARLGQRADYWKELDTAFQKGFLESYSRNSHIIVSHKKGTDPYVDFLRMAGFRRFPLREPRLTPLLQSYLDAMSSHLRSGSVARDQVLVPARLFELNGEILPVLYGETSPVGAKPHQNLLSDRRFLEMLRDGYFPLGENVLINFSQTAALHDLAHLLTFMREPAYMAALRKGATRFLEEGTFTSKGAVEAHQFARIFHVTETMSLVPREHRGRLQEVLELEPLGVEHSYTTPELRAHFERFTDRALRKLRARVALALPEIVRHYGGAAADAVIRDNADSFVFSRRPSQFGESVFALLHRAFRVELLQESRAERIEYVSQGAVLLLESTRITPVEWIEAAMRSEVPVDSVLFRFICKSGVWPQGSLMYMSHCR